MIRINDILDKFLENNPGFETDMIDRAYVYSASVHAGQMRLSGEPYLSHPLEVAGILATLKLDAVSIAAGLLHDVVEDTHATIDEIKDMFGSEITHIVSGVTKLSGISFDSYHQRQAENVRRMILAMADDIRVILVKLADRIHNMRTLQFHKSEEKKKKIARETLDIYAPIAARLGMYKIKNQLENLSFIYLYPDQHAFIQKLLNKDKDERDEYIPAVKNYIEKKLALNNLKGRVTGRYKSPFSIYRKMLTRGLTFDDIYDIVAFRIILDSESQCYKSLGLIHSLWKPIDQKFKDYIARPKPNMYQSLHTTVIGFSGERIEIQIRTFEMDDVAKSGIAAHWSYKEGLRVDKKTSEMFQWLQNLVENQKNIKNPDEFLENVKIDLFPDEVYTFTPTGEVKTLVRGATPVDFAYLIHSEVGNQCVGAKVNGCIVSLKYELKTGDTVKILTARGHKPSKNWLNFVKTVRARSRIRQWIKTQEKERSLPLGKEMCEKGFRKYNLNFNALCKSGRMEKILKDFGVKSIDDLIENVGYGKNTPLQIIKKFLPDLEQKQREEEVVSGKTSQKGSDEKKQIGVLVKGEKDILVKFGKCCQPVPGDPITGYITRGFGVTVHKTDCINALKMNPERQIDVLWNNDKETYPAVIRVHSMDRFGLLADITGSIRKDGAHITDGDIKTLENKDAVNLFTISVRNTEHIGKIISGLKEIKGIIDIERMR
ncbi:MAG TPA: GTP pyrophosphokinase [Desulfobacteraceae bacterium]|nr:GTP pyrophosphokinase [Desulfobacteraceae bacterium]